MPASRAEQIILDRFLQKCLTAGGLRSGFVLRRRAVLYVQPEHPDVDLESGITDLVERQLLTASESGDFLFLTAAGIEEIERVTSVSGTPSE